jgi:hypothetical protein
VRCYGGIYDLPQNEAAQRRYCEALAGPDTLKPKEGLAELNPSTATTLLVQVGGKTGGRGFIVEERPGLCLYPQRYVITATHCPRAILGAPGFRDDWDETLRGVLGSSVGGIPVRRPDRRHRSPRLPDNQELGEQAMAYEELIEAAMLLPIGAAIAWDTTVPVSVIALDGHPIAGKAQHLGHWLSIDETSDRSPRARPYSTRGSGLKFGRA